MGRTKEFDPDAALRRAMGLFWRQGYEATSMQDLVDCLGLGRGSIYGAFGGKRELYLQALRRYVEDSGQAFVEHLSAPGRAFDAVCGMIRHYAEMSVEDAEFKGCFMVNTAVELPADEQAGRQVESSLSVMETALTSALMRARAEGDLPEGRDPAALARFLVTLLQGMRVVGKTRARGRYLEDTVEQAIALLK
ncbi:TetR/AcrR family transcriptional regulator [Saccharopolyspora taberi]|uniref:TetR/AcrR family transcriptional regulator n=1 Tax=Saccharopolyspora taberi TaxID=60895 RepID=A0ABN3VM26_9PSEU